MPGIIVDQTYELLTYIEQGDRVAVQFTWRATTSVGLGTIAAGTPLVSHVAAFYLFDGNRIRRQSSYDCYEPLAA